MKKKILIITKSLSLGGAERVSVLLAEWMKKRNVEVALVTLSKDREKGYELNKSIKRFAINEDSNLSAIAIIINLRKKLKEYKPSGVLIMGVPLCVYVMPAICGLGIDTIVSERNDPSRFSGKLLTKILSRVFMLYAKGYVFQTEEAKEYYPYIVRKKSTVIPNPITIDRMPDPFEGERTKRIVSVGRLVPQKNHKLLIKAFKEISEKYPDYSLVIYGNGCEKENLIKLIEELRLSKRVILAGTSNDIFNDILDARMFVLSSDFEGLPNALIEAMALGIPVISTNCSSGGPASLISNMKNGILVNVGDINEMISSIEKLIINDDLAINIGREAIKIRDILNREKICENWMKFLYGIIDSQ